MNLDKFSGGLCAKIDILSIDFKFLSIVNELLKITLCVLDNNMLTYYPVFGSQTSIFFLCAPSNYTKSVFVESFISVIWVNLIYL